MTPKTVQLLLALEPGVPCDAWEAARHAGLRAVQGVSRRARYIDSKMLRTWMEDGPRGEPVLHVCREITGHCLRTVRTGLFLGAVDSSQLRNVEDFDLPASYLSALTMVGYGVVGLLKPCSGAYIYRNEPSIYPTSRWTKISTAPITALIERGILTKIAEDELAEFWLVSPTVILPQTRRQFQQE